MQHWRSAGYSAESKKHLRTPRRGNIPLTSSVNSLSGLVAGRNKNEETHMAHDHVNHGDGVSRRHALECMLWAGTGVLWTVTGGVPKSSLMGSAQAAEGGFTFLQISDSHVGFDKAANPNALGTLQEAIAKVKALPSKPAFMLHTGDITHLSKPKQFDDAAQVIGSAGLDVHYVPGEHDNLDEVPLKSYLERYGKNTKGTGWYSFDQKGVHFIGLNNVMDLKAGGMGLLGSEQLAWLADDVKGLSASTPIVVFAHIPLWTISKDWGWGTDDSEQALSMLKRFGSVTVLNGHIHQLMQKVEGNVNFHTARSTAFPQPAPGTAPAPLPLVVPAEKLHSVLGIRTVVYTQGQELLAVTDQPLAAG
jgi:hypothetical protein